MFESIYHQVMNDYYELRSSVLSISASKHERCYLLRFDRFLRDNVSSHDMLNEGLIDQWLATLSGKSSSIENEVIVVRQFLHYHDNVILFNILRNDCQAGKRSKKDFCCCI